MRWLLLLIVLLAGCIQVTDADAEATPRVSVSWSESRQSNNDQTTVSRSVTLTAAHGIDDWHEIAVIGCKAPTEGPIETPHRFSSCGSSLTIKHVETGETLYRRTSEGQVTTNAHP